MQSSVEPTRNEALPDVEEVPRVERDIKARLGFIASTPRGKPRDRLRDITRGIAEIRIRPGRNSISVIRPGTGIALRRHSVAQFAIIYAYFEPDSAHPRGLVSIRAVRHRRVENVFAGVREPLPI